MEIASAFFPICVYQCSSVVEKSEADLDADGEALGPERACSDGGHGRCDACAGGEDAGARDAAGVDDAVEMIAGPGDAVPVEDVVAADDAQVAEQLIAGVDIGFGDDAEVMGDGAAAVAGQGEESAGKGLSGPAVGDGLEEGRVAVDGQGVIVDAHGEFDVAEDGELIEGEGVAQADLAAVEGVARAEDIGDERVEADRLDGAVEDDLAGEAAAGGVEFEGLVKVGVAIAEKEVGLEIPAVREVQDHVGIEV